LAVSTILTRLREADPGATVFAHDLDDGGLFLGATPELLVSAQGMRISAMALAGSAPRDDDHRRITELLDSTKQRKEHGLVVEHLVRVLLPRCRPFAVPGSPHARRLGNLLHLESLVEADLLRPDYLELIAALHPTPAVCGLPTTAAAHYLARRERLHRGLYAGVLGWLTDDACRCVVPLRGGILRDGRARLFAGAGIVETSDADDEWAETELKLAVMRRALQG
jgi:isochorismate synthase